jgi:hypothetical protein
VPATWDPRDGDPPDDRCAMPLHAWAIARFALAIILGVAIVAALL